jgi:TrmH family RNA methyltransferase
MPPGGPVTCIESLSNRRVKVYRSLATAKGRREHGLFQLEGTALIAEALAAGTTLKRAYWCPERARHERDTGLAETLAGKTQLFLVSERVLCHMTSTVTPQPIAAEARIPATELEQVAVPDQSLIVAPANVHDPGNMGTIIRTAHSVGATALVAVGDGVDPYGPKVVRATMGSLFAVTIVRERHADRFLAWCEQNHCTIAAATVSARQSLFEARFEPRTAIVLGSESQGLPEEFTGSDVRELSIPMPGGTESLNVAVAAGVMMYEYRRQHQLREPSRSTKGCEGAK